MSEHDKPFPEKQFDFGTAIVVFMLGFMLGFLACHKLYSGIDERHSPIIKG